MKTLEDQLNAKADATLKGHIQNIVNPLRRFHERLGFNGYPGSNTKMKNRKGEEVASLGGYAAAIEENLFESMCEPFRESFRKEFIGKVEAMQREMENYIGELTVDPEQ